MPSVADCVLPGNDRATTFTRHVGEGLPTLVRKRVRVLFPMPAVELGDRDRACVQRVDDEAYVHDGFRVYCHTPVEPDALPEGITLPLMYMMVIYDHD